ncbi:hypothetical protein DAH50_25705 [Escherichia coli]|nr:hypothetical protein DAH50_25705 [Escherichia coli]
MRDLILQLSKSSIYSTKPFIFYNKIHDTELINALRDKARNSVSMFQAIVNEEICNGKFGTASQ